MPAAAGTAATSSTAASAAGTFGLTRRRVAAATPAAIIDVPNLRQRRCDLGITRGSLALQSGQPRLHAGGFDVTARAELA